MDQVKLIYRSNEAYSAHVSRSLHTLLVDEYFVVITLNSFQLRMIESGHMNEVLNYDFLNLPGGGGGPPLSQQQLGSPGRPSGGP